MIPYHINKTPRVRIANSNDCIKGYHQFFHVQQNLFLIQNYSLGSFRRIFITFDKQSVTSSKYTDAFCRGSRLSARSFSRNFVYLAYPDTGCKI